MQIQNLNSIILSRTFFYVLFLLITSTVQGQITRDVGEIAVIEGDNNIIFTPLNSTTIPPTPCGQVSVNMRELGLRFYQGHDNEFDVLVMFTNFNHLLLPNNCNEQANAFFSLVSNSIEGIGLNTFDNSNLFGSDRGVLQGVINMGNVVTRPANPFIRLPGNNDHMLSLMGQEIGHRWGAFIQVDQDFNSNNNLVNGVNLLLGRQNAHWSFFLHTGSVTSNAGLTQASSLEGNFWQPTNFGFQTASITDGYCPLDLYLMGLIPANQVGNPFVILNPNNVNPNANINTAPNAGTQAQGAQQNVNIQNIIDVEGTRNPGFADSPKIFRHAFILLTQQGVNVTQAQINQVNTYRIAWENYFSDMTQNSGAVVTNLDNVLFVDRSNSGNENGSLTNPYNSVLKGRDSSNRNGTIIITGGQYQENLTFDSPLTLRAVLGNVRIGN